MKSGPGCYKALLAPGIECQALDHGAGFVTSGGNAVQMRSWGQDAFMGRQANRGKTLHGPDFRRE